MKISFTVTILSLLFSSTVADEGRLLRTQRRIADYEGAMANANNVTFKFDPSTTALVVIDPQNDFLSENGVAWGVVGESVVENNVVDNIEYLFQAAANNDFLTFISPHHYFPHDHKWEFEGELEKVMHGLGMFDRAGPLNLTGFEGSGADWLDQYKPYIVGAENVIVTNPHKVYGPETNDLVLQLRKRKMDSVILAGMSANLCVEAHMRALTEQGFEVFVAADATAGGKTPELGDGFAAALINYKFISSGVYNTSEVVAMMKQTDTDEALVVDKTGGF
ncbi:Isochorismatase family [Seminavis robusta]|uniref:Isochorismatase family n=1 Tax=Seminavis robusta TaxID=568900 RepID=A0A9N8DBF2_9STRA|nr:Isochorismatase family [Seminavis robusta]|eukprot:Sro65_g036650.1 Isochorismatase family (278) ;mRNA; r:36897-37818